MSTARYVTIPKFAEMSGYSIKAIEHKVHLGVWVEGQQYRRAPDNRVLIDVVGVERWVEGQQAQSKQGKAA